MKLLSANAFNLYMCKILLLGRNHRQINRLTALPNGLPRWPSMLGRLPFEREVGGLIPAPDRPKSLKLVVLAFHLRA